MRRCTLSQVQNGRNNLETENWHLVSSAEERRSERPRGAGIILCFFLPPLLLLLLVVLQVSQYPARGTQDGHKQDCHSYCLLLRDTDTQRWLNSSYLAAYETTFFFSNVPNNDSNESDGNKWVRMVNTVYIHQSLLFSAGK